MAAHLVNPSTKFEDPTAIRSWVVSSDISHRIPLTMRLQPLRICAVSRDLCVAANFSHIFEIPDPDLPIHYITFWRYDKDKWSYLAKQCMALCWRPHSSLALSAPLTSSYMLLRLYDNRYQLLKPADGGNHVGLLSDFPWWRHRSLR